MKVMTQHTGKIKMHEDSFYSKVLFTGRSLSVTMPWTPIPLTCVHGSFFFIAYSNQHGVVLEKVNTDRMVLTPCHVHSPLPFLVLQNTRQFCMYSEISLVLVNYTSTQ